MKDMKGQQNGGSGLRDQSTQVHCICHLKIVAGTLHLHPKPLNPKPETPLNPKP